MRPKIRKFTPLSETMHILGDPGADGGAEDENQNGRENIRRAKVRKKNTYFCLSNVFPPVLISVFGPTICPWVSEDGRCNEHPRPFKCAVALLLFSRVEIWARTAHATQILFGGEQSSQSPRYPYPAERFPFLVSRSAG